VVHWLHASFRGLVGSFSGFYAAKRVLENNKKLYNDKQIRRWWAYHYFVVYQDVIVTCL